MYGQQTHHFKQRTYEDSRYPDPGYQAYYNMRLFTPDFLDAMWEDREWEGGFDRGEI